MTVQETPEARLKRMRMRAWRRGTKEMDIVLGPFADERLAGMDEAALAAFDALLWENDQDLMAWLLGQQAVPDRHAALIAEVGVFARGRFGARG